MSHLTYVNLLIQLATHGIPVQRRPAIHRTQNSSVDLTFEQFEQKVDLQKRICKNSQMYV